MLRVRYCLWFIRFEAYLQALTFCQVSWFEKPTATDRLVLTHYLLNPAHSEIVDTALCTIAVITLIPLTSATLPSPVHVPMTHPSQILLRYRLAASFRTQGKSQARGANRSSPRRGAGPFDLHE